MKPLRVAANGLGVHTRRRHGNCSGAQLGGFAVECQKTTTGSWIVFSRNATRQEAQVVADCLGGLGQPTRIIAPT